MLMSVVISNKMYNRDGLLFISMSICYITVENIKVTSSLLLSEIIAQFLKGPLHFNELSRRTVKKLIKNEKS